MYPEINVFLGGNQLEILRGLSRNEWNGITYGPNDFEKHYDHRNVLCTDFISISSSGPGGVFFKCYSDVSLDSYESVEIKNLGVTKNTDAEMKKFVNIESMKSIMESKIDFGISENDLLSFLCEKKKVTRILSNDEFIDNNNLSRKVNYDVGVMFSGLNLKMMVCFLGVEYRILFTFDQESMNKILGDWVTYLDME